MTTNQSAAAAIVAATLAGLVTMAFHPSGHDVVRNASAGASNALVTGVHWLAIVAQPLLLAGMLALTLALGARRDLAVGAFVFYAVAALAVIVAAAASGLLAPATVRGMDGADAAARAAMLDALRWSGLLNRVFAQVYVLLAGVAVVLWSCAMLADATFARWLAGYGIVLGLAMAGGILTGRLSLGIHGFGLVMLGQGIWMAGVAVRLWRHGAS